MLVQAILYFCFTILLVLKLKAWDDETSGHCYSTLNIASSTAVHPREDQIYLSVSSTYWFATLNLSVGVALSTMANTLESSRKPTVNQAHHDWNEHIKALSGVFHVLSINTYSAIYGTDKKQMVLTIAMLQYQLHYYMLFSLRRSNQPYLSGESENSWGFGQVVALVLLGSTILECIQELIGMRFV